MLLRLAVAACLIASPAAAQLTTKHVVVDTIPTVTVGTIPAVQLKDEAGNAYGVKHVSNKPRVVSQDYLFSVAEGEVAGHAVWRKTGYNAALTTTDRAAFPVDAAYVFPTAAGNVEVYSSSVEDDPAKADTSAGTGCQAVTIAYLDAAYAEKSVDVATNGQTAVATTVGDIFRIQTFRCKTFGTAGKNAGAIDVRHTSDTPVYSRIVAGENRGRNGVWTVPAGKTLYLTSVAISGVATTNNAYGQFSLDASYNEASGQVWTNGLTFMSLTETAFGTGQSFQRTFLAPIKIPATVDIVPNARVSAGAGIVSVDMRGWLE